MTVLPHCRTAYGTYTTVVWCILFVLYCTTVWGFVSVLCLVRCVVCAVCISSVTDSVVGTKFIVYRSGYWYVYSSVLGHV